MDRRCSGILMHITSLPQGNAYIFLDFLEKSGQRLWQILPIGPVGEGNSPYQSPSAFAGNTNFIDRKALIEDEDALQRFQQENRYWLEDYALFKILKEIFPHKKWNEWPSEYKYRDKKTLEDFKIKYKKEMEEIVKEQFYFSYQWDRIKTYANGKGIKIIGDIPIFVATDSADTWAHQDIFLLDKNGSPKEVSGVPPDIFSPEGQLWGNVLYDWKELKNQGYDWWIKRFEQSFKRYDILRIDHFRGFEAFWSIKSDATTAKEGTWVKGPGIDFFRQIEKSLGKLPIIAEDLGFITPDVKKLLEETGFPGMKILEFAFSPDGTSEYLPHRCPVNSVIYTGTHDNMTVVEWYETADKGVKKFCDSYLRKYLEEKNGNIDAPINWCMIEAAWASPCIMAIAPMQDFLGLGAEGRMNTPSVPYGNWEWKGTEEELDEELAKRIKDMTKKYDRQG